MRLLTKVKVNSLAYFMTLKYRTNFFTLDRLPVNYQANTETDDQFKNTTNVSLEKNRRFKTTVLVTV